MNISKLIKFCVFLLTLFMQISNSISLYAEEKTNSPDLALYIAPGEVINESIIIDFDVDWYKIDLQKGDIYSFEIDVLGGENPDIVAELFDSNGVLLSINDDGLENLGAKIVWKSLSTETAYLKIKTSGRSYGDFNNKGGGVANCDYRLTVGIPISNAPPMLYEPVIVNKTLGINDPLSVFINAADPDEDELRYDFNWGDGTKKWGAKQKRIHTYTSPGNYCLKVRVRDIHDAKSNWSNCITITVYEQSPTTDNAFLLFCSSDNSSFGLKKVDINNSENFSEIIDIDNPYKNSEKPHLFRLSNGQYAAVYNAIVENDSFRSVIFHNLITGYSTVIKPFAYEKNKLNATMHARGLQLSNGKLLIAFSGIDIIKFKEEKSIPAESKIYTYESNDFGASWKQTNTLQSALEDYPDLSGLWQPSLYEREDGHVILLGVEQRSNPSGVCEDSDWIGYRDDTIVMFESFDYGTTFTVKRKVVSGLCGQSFNEPALVNKYIGDDSLELIYHDNRSDDLNIIQSNDYGANWTSDNTLIPAKLNFDTRYPVKLDTDTTAFIYRRLAIKKNQFSDYHEIAQKNGNVWVTSVINEIPSGYMMCKLK